MNPAGKNRSLLGGSHDVFSLSQLNKTKQKKSTFAATGLIKSLEVCLFIYFNGIVTGISTHGCSMTFRPTVSGWVPPFPQIINRATGQSCCCPAFRQQIFLKCKSLSPLAVPRTIFLLSVHVQTWRKPAGLSQITVPSQRAMGAFHPRSNLCQERKEKKRNGVKKVSQVHLCPKSNGLQRF